MVLAPYVKEFQPRFLLDSGVKFHELYDVKTDIPAFSIITDASLLDINGGYTERASCTARTGSGCKWARYEFGFHFPEIVEREFPELHRTIMMAIDQKIPKLVEDYLQRVDRRYSLHTNWFEDEA